MKNWRLQLWKLRSPTICHLQDGDPGKLVMSCQSKSQGLRTRGVDSVNPSPRSGEDTMSCPQLSSEAGKKERTTPLSPFVLFRP